MKCKDGCIRCFALAQNEMWCLGVGLKWQVVECETHVRCGVTGGGDVFHLPERRGVFSFTARSQVLAGRGVLFHLTETRAEFFSDRERSCVFFDRTR